MNTKKLIIIVTIVVFLAAASYYLAVMKKISSSVVPASNVAAGDEMDLDKIFGLDQKKPGTKVYYSKNLGIGFTYRPEGAFNPEITEFGDKISVGGQEIEVFTKDPNISFQQALEEKFLSGYKPADCFIKMAPTGANDQKLSDYEAATISFPPTSDPSAPWWENSDKCPPHYSETNGIEYFLMNKGVPGKFLYVRIGQSSAVPDGTSLPGEQIYNWSRSLRIIK